MIGHDRSAILIGRGARRAEQLLIGEVLDRVADSPPQQSLDRPVQIVVPSHSLREHLLTRLVTVGGRSLVGVRCSTHRALALQVLANSGVDPASASAIELARRLHDSSALAFGGLLTHAGHSYGCVGQDELMTVAHQERDVMTSFAERLRDLGFQVPVVSLRSTPTMSVIDSLPGIDEIRPDNYALYDLSQV